MRYGCIVLDIDLPLYEETVMSIPLQAAGSPSPPGGLQLVIGSDFSGGQNTFIDTIAKNDSAMLIPVC